MNNVLGVNESLKVIKDLFINGPDCFALHILQPSEMCLRLQ
jgi:hypothetical protein